MGSLLDRLDRFLFSAGASPLIWMTFLFFIFAFGWINYTPLLTWPNPSLNLIQIDPDVWMRLTKIRTLLQDGNLYNRAVTVTNAPYGGVETPWTHPVDFILRLYTNLCRLVFQ